MFSKDQAWSYDQPKAQVWPLLRRTHQAVILRYDQAQSLENVLISGLEIPSHHQEDQNAQGDHRSGFQDA